MSREYFDRVGLFGFVGCVISLIAGVCSRAHLEQSLLPFGFSPVSLGFVGFGCYFVLAVVSFWTATRILKNKLYGFTMLLRWLDHFMVLAAVGFSLFLVEFAIRVDNPCPFCYLLHIMNGLMFVHYVYGLFSRRRTIIVHDL